MRFLQGSDKQTVRLTRQNDLTWNRSRWPWSRREQET